MEAQLAWLDDPQVFRVNQLPAHSDHQFFCIDGRHGSRRQ